MLKSSFSCPSNCLCSPPGILLLLVQKKYQEKDTRRCRPCGLPCAARQWRDTKNSLTLRQVWRLVPPPVPLLSGTEWGTARLRIPVQVCDNRMIQIYTDDRIDKSGCNCPLFSQIEKEIDHQPATGDKMNRHWSRFDQEEGKEKQHDSFWP